jgi:ABC-type transporter MlaC component
MKSVALLAIILSWTLSATAVAEPEAVAKEFLQDLISFAEAQDKGIDNSAAHDKLRGRIHFASFAQRALGKRAKAIKASEKKEFERLLIELVEKSAFPRARQLLPYKDEVKISKVGKDVIVDGRWFKEKNGDRVVREFQMKLLFDAQERIIDADFDGQPVSQNIARQVDKHMQKKSFADLLAQMRKRVDSLTKK